MKGSPAVALAENRIYLASRSPRRAELLKQIGVNFEPLLLREASSRQADVDETRLVNEAAADYVHRIAQTKAEIGRMRLLQRGLADLPVLAADTAVAVNGHFWPCTIFQTMAVAAIGNFGSGAPSMYSKLGSSLPA